MLHLKIRELTSDEVTNVWPLARTSPRNHSLLGWKYVVREAIRRGGGIVGAIAEDGIVHGVATYEPVLSVRAGRVLRVHTFASFELSRRAPVRQALLEELDRVADLLDCDAVSVGALNRAHVRPIRQPIRSVRTARNGDPAERA